MAYAPVLCVLPSQYEASPTEATEHVTHRNRPHHSKHKTKVWLYVALISRGFLPFMDIFIPPPTHTHTHPQAANAWPLVNARRWR